MSRAGEYVSDFKQSFATTKPVYKLVKGVPTKVDDLDLTEFLNSNKSSELKAILNKYLDLGIIESSGVISHDFDTTAMKDRSLYDDIIDDERADLADYADAINKLNDLRVKYNLPDTMSYKEVVGEIIGKSNKATDNVNELINKANEEVKANETKKIESTPKQEEL